MKVEPPMISRTALAAHTCTVRMVSPSPPITFTPRGEDAFVYHAAAFGGEHISSEWNAGPRMTAWSMSRWS